MKGYDFDNSFVINHISFGEKKDFSRIKMRFPDTDLSNPLNGIKVDQPEDTKNLKVLFYLKAVPSIFEADSLLGDTIFGKWLATEIFQLKVAHEVDINAHDNLIKFQYEVSPFAVKYSNAKENLL